MIINHNMGAMNANRNMNINAGAANKSMQKLSSGLRINSAADDAAGLAISEKMRGQIRGLDQASANAQGGISMVQTAEGALSETENILQRMRELAVQAGNDTNVGVDRTEIQKEMNQLSSEINRIGNTTEFNTKSLLKGDGGIDIAKTAAFADVNLAGGSTTNVEATQATTITTAAGAGDTMKFTLNGQEINVTFAAAAANGHLATEVYNATSNSVTVNLAAVPDLTTTATALKDAISAVINANDTLKGNYSASSALGVLTVAATAGGDFAGSAGNIALVTEVGATVMTGGAAAVGTTTQAFATKTLDFSAIDTVAEATAMVGKGMTVNGTQLEFYNSNNGAYTGNAQGIDISDAIEAAAGANDEAFAKAIADQADIDGVAVVQATNTIVITATTGGTVGNNISLTDGGIKTQFEATLQVGANKGQGFKIDINDMRAGALTVTGSAGDDATEGAKFTTANSVSNGTDSTLREAALDVSTYENATAAVKVINNAIEAVSSERSKLGAFQNRLEHTIANLGTSSENLTSAESRIRDVDMAKEMSTFSKNNILSQAAQAMLAQANQQPQQVLQLLR